MSVYNLDVYNAINAYSKQISLNPLVQKKKVAMALKSLVESAVSEDSEREENDIDQEVEETGED